MSGFRDGEPQDPIAAPDPAVAAPLAPVDPLQMQLVEGVTAHRIADRVQPILAGGIVLGTFIVVLIFAFVQIPDSNQAAFNIVLGSLVGGFVSVIQYYFGSSAGSARKDAIVAAATVGK